MHVLPLAMDDSQKSSIIDQILTSKQAEAMEHLSPSETVGQLLKQLTTKEADVLRRRYGLAGQTSQTLEEIGKSYHVTRERIRQIERLTIQKLLQSKDFEETLRAISTAVTQVLTSHGGYLEDSSLMKTLLQIAGDTVDNCNAMTFLLAELMTGHVDRIEATQQIQSGWKIRHAPLEVLQGLIHALVEFFVQVGAPVPLDDFLARFRETPYAKENAARLTDETILAAVDLSTALSHNPYGDYGLKRWGHVQPRRMNDKIYLVLKKAGKPLHFTEITKQINETSFDERQAYPPTVHNELILDKKYVLVGRGIYALREWGYRPGVVADVIVSILQSSSQPLTRPAIVEAVLKQRFVKRNTIHLALTNRERFSKTADGKYTLTQHQSHVPLSDRR